MYNVSVDADAFLDIDGYSMESAEESCPPPLNSDSSNRLYLEKKGIACGWKHFFFQIHRAYGNEVGGNPKTR